MELKERINGIVKTSNHMVIIGSRGEAKTSLGFYLLELHEKANRDIFIYNHPQPKLLPKWIKNINKLEFLPENSCVLIDESAQDFDQYSYNKRTNIYLRNLLTIARHKNQSYIFIALTTNFINLNFLHMINVWLFKQPTLFQREEERRIIKQAYGKIQEEIKKEEFYFLDDKTWCKGKFKCPEWYNEKLSKAYAKIDAEEI